MTKQKTLQPKQKTPPTPVPPKPAASKPVSKQSAQSKFPNIFVPVFLPTGIPETKPLTPAPMSAPQSPQPTQPEHTAPVKPTEPTPTPTLTPAPAPQPAAPVQPQRSSKAVNEFVNLGAGLFTQLSFAKSEQRQAAIIQALRRLADDVGVDAQTREDIIFSYLPEEEEEKKDEMGDLFRYAIMFSLLRG